MTPTRQQRPHVPGARGGRGSGPRGASRAQPDVQVTALSSGSAWHERRESGANVLEIDSLEIEAVASGSAVIDDVSLALRPAEILALVGESGSGKTTVGLSVLGHFRPGLRHGGGTVTLYPSHTDRPAEMTALDDAALRRLRGARVTYIPQDPALSLNPGIRVGEQIREVLDIHNFGASAEERTERVRSVLAEVGLPGDDAYQARYPHQLSGGQQQRIGIAMAFAMYPDVLVLDEPTTGLDVTTQAQVLDTVRDMTVRHQVASLYITHDLAVVSEIADRVAVMLRGRIVEENTTEEVLGSPQHAYTRKLLAAVPDLAGRNRIGETAEPGAPAGSVHEPEAPAGSSAGFAGRPEAGSAAAAVRAAGASAVVLEVSELGLAYGENTVLDGIDLELEAGECTLLLGESGSGKTTLSRSIAGILDSYTGRVCYRGEELAKNTRQRTLDQRKQIQYIFQSPFSSLNPRRTLGQSLAVPLEMSGELNAAGRRDRVKDALDAVRLGRQFYSRRPGDLSGGERQRAAIARALVNMPSVLICDEITSALDVSVQASILALLRTLQEERGLAMLFVTHNIALARHIASRVAVLNKGVLVEAGPVDEVLDTPQHAYTRELLTNVPKL
ncbi:ABC transporter ATP-binding protein [Brevibacterium daeguense]|uniref:ABC transporter ATP-binding protein n=1 Tax=Brevibacterium daeguense TaxID=909936 RepID=A0ABP8EHP4_9MICO|nr:ABC transporter ATP-binding protein [Brevibacterium daeguense]